jgi:outer membrane immunogenic protein
MLRTLTVAAVLATAAAAMPAAAAEFSGFRAELQGGWNSTSIGYVSALGVNYENSKSAFGYGAEVGYDFPISESVIIGALGNVSGSTQSYTDMLCPSGTSACLLGRPNVNANLGVNFSLMGRVGFKVADSTLLYGGLGYANQNVKYYITPVGGVTAEDSRSYGGFRLAAGVEQAFGESFYGKVEYRYSNYKDDVTTNQIFAGVGMRF